MCASVRPPIPHEGRDAWRKVMPHAERVDAHYHRLGQLVYPASGVLVTTSAGGTWVAPANRVAWTPPGHAHQHRIYGETDIRSVAISLEFCAELPSHPCVFSVTGLAREALLAVTDGRSARAGRRDRICAVIVDELSELDIEPLHLPEPVDPCLRAVTEMVHAHPDDNSSLGQMAHTVGSSERTLSRRFRDELGMSFHQWRTLLRVQHAMIHLSNGLSVSHTAVELGWANPSSFIDAFEAIIGQTPGRYVRLSRQNA